MKVEDGTLDLTFTREAGDLPVCSVRIRNLWPDLRAPAAPPAPTLVASPEGLWATWPPLPEPDVARVSVQYEGTPGSTPSSLSESALARSRAWIPYSALPSTPRGSVALVSIDLFGNRSVAGRVTLVSSVAANPPVHAPVGASRIVQASPNPFNASIRIQFALEDRGHPLTILDLGGRKVRAFRISDLVVGMHSVTWDRRDAHGHEVASGEFVVELRTMAGADFRKVTLLK